jgi:hypothetical protein
MECYGRLESKLSLCKTLDVVNGFPEDKLGIWSLRVCAAANIRLKILLWQLLSRSTLEVCVRYARGCFRLVEIRVAITVTIDPMCAGVQTKAFSL